MVAAIPTTFNRLHREPLGVVRGPSVWAVSFGVAGAFFRRSPGSPRRPLTEWRPILKPLRAEGDLLGGLLGRQALALSPPRPLFVESLPNLLFALASRHSVLRESGPQGAGFSPAVPGSGKSAGRAEPIGVGCCRRHGFPGTRKQLLGARRPLQSLPRWPFLGPQGRRNTPIIWGSRSAWQSPEPGPGWLYWARQELTRPGGLGRRVDPPTRNLRRC